MLNWTINFLILAIVAGLLGFTGIAGAATEIAKVLFIIFLGTWVIAILAIGFFGKKK